MDDEFEDVWEVESRKGEGGGVAVVWDWGREREGRGWDGKGMGKGRRICRAGGSGGDGLCGGGDSDIGRGTPMALEASHIYKPPPFSPPHLLYHHTPSHPPTRHHTIPLHAVVFSNRTKLSFGKGICKCEAAFPGGMICAQGGISIYTVLLQRHRMPLIYKHPRHHPPLRTLPLPLPPLPSSINPPPRHQINPTNTNRNPPNDPPRPELPRQRHFPPPC